MKEKYRILEQAVIGLIKDGIKSKLVNIPNARVSLKIAYGLARQIEDSDLIIICTDLLKSTGLSDEQMLRHQEEGYEFASTRSFLRGYYDIAREERRKLR